VCRGNAAVGSTRAGLAEYESLRSGYDVHMDRDDATFRAWLDDDPAGRCTATHTVDSVTLRCDGQAGHGGEVHQGSIDGHPVTWDNHQRQ